MLPVNRIVVDAELVHNWSQRYSHLAYFKVLTPAAREAIQAAHLEHHRTGTDAQLLAQQLVAQFPQELANRLEGWPSRS